MRMTRWIRYWWLGAVMPVLPAPALADELTFRDVMQGLAQEMERVNAALFVEDFATLAAAAEAIADHPSPSLAERRRVMMALGPGMVKLKAADTVVHDAAQALRAAAEAGDMESALVHQHSVMKGCIACHDAFRSRLKDALAPGG